MTKYTLPVATENILGGVKIGQGIDVTQDGVISIHEYSKINTTIQELNNSVKEGKLLIAEAITEKNVPTSVDDTFQTMAENIHRIPNSFSGVYKYSILYNSIEINTQILSYEVK